MAAGVIFNQGSGGACGFRVIRLSETAGKIRPGENHGRCEARRLDENYTRLPINEFVNCRRAWRWSNRLDRK
jgi:hypothetical protein